MKKIIIAAGIATAMTPLAIKSEVFADELNIAENKARSLEVGIVNVKPTTNLNIRASHGTNYRVVGKIPGGKKVTILEKVNGWYKVEYKGIKGYSSAQYIKLGQEENKEQSVSTSSKIGKVVNLNGTRLNIRSGASTSYGVIGTLKEGNTVNILGTTNGWYKIEVGKGIGYVSSKYVKETNATSSTKPSTSTSNGIVEVSSSNVGKIATVTADSLNVRSGNSVNYSVVTRVSRGSSVQVLNMYSNGWGKIKLSTGISGYVNTKYLNNYRTGSLSSSTTQNNNVGTNTQVSESNKASKVVALAKSKIGCPYVWGAEGPNSFDCSGLTRYVYKNAVGITIPRNSSAQASAGYAVSRSNLKPGDLVFFNTNGKGISHVGLYIGNNEMIHSPKPGDNVKVVKITSSYYSSRFVTARRIVD